MEKGYNNTSEILGVNKCVYLQEWHQKDGLVAVQRERMQYNTPLPFWLTHLSVPLPVPFTIFSEAKSTIRSDFN